MSNQTARFQHRDPTLWRITKRLADRFVEMTGVVDQAYLKEVGINYSTFSTYLTGRTAMPGWVQARLLEYVSWDWAWGLATNERVVLAESILRDRATTQTARLRVMALYFGVLRAAHDFSGHARLVRDLRRRFPADRYPLERAAIAHDECVILDAQAGRFVRRSRCGISGDQAMGSCLSIASPCRGRGILRSRCAGSSPAGQGSKSSVSRSFRSTTLGRITSKPLSSESWTECVREQLLPNRTATAYHLYALVHVETVLGDFPSAHNSLDRLRLLCESESSAGDGRSELWLRYDLALAAITERSQGSEAARQHFIRACERLRQLGCATWEADLLRQMQQYYNVSDIA